MASLYRAVFFYVIIYSNLRNSDSLKFQDFPKFRGAVIEYGAKYLISSSKDTILFNLEKYKDMVEQLKNLTDPPDIIVFPECGLSSIEWLREGNKIYAEEVPDHKKQAVPCEESDTEVLKTLSCIARNNLVYLVVNLIEKAEESNETLLYNTNVVFDRQGKIISRYRKFNLFGSDGKPLAKPKHPDHSYFDTDFGVRFGSFTCFDIIFKTPALDLVRDYNVTHIAFPTAWFSEQPFLTAIEEQAAWSTGSRAVLLASGYNNPKYGSTGSGIYFPYGDQETFEQRSLMVQQKMDFAIVSWIPKTIDKLDLDRPFQSDTVVKIFNYEGTSKMKLKTDKLDVYTTKTLEESHNYEFVPGSLNLTVQSVTTITEQVCDRGLCCNFEFNKTTTYCWSDTKKSLTGDDFGRFRYRLAAFNGVRTYDGVTTGGVQICSIISCLDNDGIDSCAKRTDRDDVTPNFTVLSSGLKYEQCSTSFENVQIQARFKYGNNTFLTSNILLASPKNVPSYMIKYGTIPHSNSYKIEQLTSENDTAVFEFRTVSALSNPLSVNLYNRVFDLDGTGMTTSQSSFSLNVSIALLIMSVLFLFSVVIC